MHRPPSHWRAMSRERESAPEGLQWRDSSWPTKGRYPESDVKKWSARGTRATDLAVSAWGHRTRNWLTGTACCILQGDLHGGQEPRHEQVARAADGAGKQLDFDNVSQRRRPLSGAAADNQTVFIKFGEIARTVKVRCGGQQKGGGKHERMNAMRSI